MSKKKGRPKEINSRVRFKGTRMTIEEDFRFKKVCEKEGYSESEGLRMAAKALEYLSENGMIYCLTKNMKTIYCLTIIRAKMANLAQNRLKMA